jgi:hypothetical protein
MNPWGKEGGIGRFRWQDVWKVIQGIHKEDGAGARSNQCNMCCLELLEKAGDSLEPDFDAPLDRNRSRAAKARSRVINEWNSKPQNEEKETIINPGACS